MSQKKDSVLVCVTDPLDAGSLDWLLINTKGYNVTILVAGELAHDLSLPSAWNVREMGEFFDSEQWQQDFLSFLGSWGQIPLQNETSFDSLFPYPDGYSGWAIYTSYLRIGVNPAHHKMKMLWQVARAVAAVCPSHIYVHVKNRVRARLLEDLFSRRGIGCGYTPGSNRPSASIWNTRGTWLLKSLIIAIGMPLFFIARGLFAKILSRPRKRDQRSSSPTAVVTTSFPRHFSEEDDGLSNWYFFDFAKRCKEMNPDIRLRYMVYTYIPSFGGTSSLNKYFPFAWRGLKKSGDVAPVPETKMGLGIYLRLLPKQLAYLIRNYRLEGDAAYQGSFSFAGVDMAELVLPSARRAVKQMAYWATAVDRICAGIRAMGNVRVVVVNEEMYVHGMHYVAAAKKLDIPCVGIQHGSVYPSHMVYILQPEQLQRMPIPDYFAAYGEYAANVLSEIGSYPKDRIWITGSPRFDKLAEKKPDREAACRRANLDSKSRIVLVATQDYQWFPSAVKAIVEICNGRPDVVVAIKMHPNDPSLAAYRAHCQHLAAKNVRFYTDQFDDLLEACDVLVSGTSTTILEATLMGRKTICVNFTSEPDPYPFVEDGPSLGARSHEELEAALRTVFDIPVDVFEQKRELFLERHLGPTVRGKAAVALSEKVAEVCGIDSKAS